MLGDIFFQSVFHHSFHTNFSCSFLHLWRHAGKRHHLGRSLIVRIHDIACHVLKKDNLCQGHHLIQNYLSSMSQKMASTRQFPCPHVQFPWVLGPRCCHKKLQKLLIIQKLEPRTAGLKPTKIGLGKHFLVINCCFQSI